MRKKKKGKGGMRRKRKFDDQDEEFVFEENEENENDHIIIDSEFVRIDPRSGNALIEDFATDKTKKKRRIGNSIRSKLGELPHEIIRMISNLFFSHKDVANFLLISRSFLQAMYELAPSCINVLFTLKKWREVMPAPEKMTPFVSKLKIRVNLQKGWVNTTEYAFLLRKFPCLKSLCMDMSRLQYTAGEVRFKGEVSEMILNIPAKLKALELSCVPMNSIFNLGNIVANYPMLERLQLKDNVRRNERELEVNESSLCEMKNLTSLSLVNMEFKTHVLLSLINKEKIHTLHIENMMPMIVNWEGVKGLKTLTCVRLVGLEKSFVKGFFLGGLENINKLCLKDIRDSDNENRDEWGMLIREKRTVEIISNDKLLEKINWRTLKELTIDESSNCSIKHLRNLEVLSLTHCKICPDDLFANHLKELRILKLVSSMILKKHFDQLKNLRELDISCSEKWGIEDECFIHLKELRVLRNTVKWNCLENLTPSFFHHLKKLRVFSTNSSASKTINMTLFNEIKKRGGCSLYLIKAGSESHQCQFRGDEIDQICEVQCSKSGCKGAKMGEVMYYSCIECFQNIRQKPVCHRHVCL